MTSKFIRAVISLGCILCSLGIAQAKNNVIEKMMATPAYEKAAANFKSALLIRLGGDLTKNSEFQISMKLDDDSICGTPSPAIIAELQIRRSHVELQNNRNILVDTYDTVKAYGVSFQFATKLTAAELEKNIVADDACYSE